MRKGFMGQLVLAVLATFAGYAGTRTDAFAAGLKTLHSFCARPDCRDGDRLEAGVVMDASGNLYGSSESGGSYGFGAIFQLSQDQQTGKWKENLIYSFCKERSFPCHDGFNPWGPLIIDVHGDLYGTTMIGDGTPSMAFELMPDDQHKKWKLKIIYAFCSRATHKSNCADGNDTFLSGLAYEGQAAGAAYDGVSPLYGTASSDRRYDAGVAFQLTPVMGNTKWKETVVHPFCAERNCADGSRPWQKLVVDGQGNLFGVAGEFEDVGIVFELSQQNGRWNETVLHRFCQAKNCEDGVFPNALAVDAQGELFGMTRFYTASVRSLTVPTVVRQMRL